MQVNPCLALANGWSASGSPQPFAAARTNVGSRNFDHSLHAG